MDFISGCDTRLVFTFPSKDSTLKYKKCVHLWNNFSCISTLVLVKKKAQCSSKAGTRQFLRWKFANRFFELNSLENKMQVKSESYKAVSKAQRQAKLEPYCLEFFKSPDQ